MESKNHTCLSGAIDALRENLKKELDKVYFVTNTGYQGIGIVLTLLGMGGYSDGAGQSRGGLWHPVVIHVDGGLHRPGRHRVPAMAGRPQFRQDQVGALGVTLFALPFFIGEIFGAFMIGTEISLPRC